MQSLLSKSCTELVDLQYLLHVRAGQHWVALCLLCGWVSCVTQMLLSVCSVSVSLSDYSSEIHLTCYEYMNARNDYILLKFDVALDSCFPILTQSPPLCVRDIHSACSQLSEGKSIPLIQGVLGRSFES